MSTVYRYYISDPTGISTKVSTLNSKILIDLDLPTTNYVSTVYNSTTQNVEVTFSIPLTPFQYEVLFNISNIVLFNGSVQNTVYVVPYNSFNRRSFNVNGIPNNNMDSVSGYSSGSMVTTNSNDIYVCTNNTQSNAVWQKIYPVNVNNPLSEINFVYFANNRDPFLTFNNSSYKAVSNFYFSGTNAYSSSPKQFTLVVRSDKEGGSFSGRIVDLNNKNIEIAVISETNTVSSKIPTAYTTTIFDNVSETPTIWEFQIIGKPSGSNNSSIYLYSLYIRLA